MRRWCGVLLVGVLALTVIIEALHVVLGMSAGGAEAGWLSVVALALAGSLVLILQLPDRWSRGFRWPLMVLGLFLAWRALWIMDGRPVRGLVIPARLEVTTATLGVVMALTATLGVRARRWSARTMLGAFGVAVLVASIVCNPISVDQRPRAGDVVVEPQRGHALAPIELKLSAQRGWIRFTVDGSDPRFGSGAWYRGPLRVVDNTVLRAVTYGPGRRPGRPVSHTYLFSKCTMEQDQAFALRKGFPERWGEYVPAVYGLMRVGKSTDIDRGLAQLMTVCVSMDADDLFGSLGIHTFLNAPQKGKAWERPCAVEFWDANSAAQTEAGLRMHGGQSRALGSVSKCSFRLYFREEYGAEPLRHALLGKGESYVLVLRSMTGDGWDFQFPERAQFVRDEFTRRLFREMGHVSPHGRFVHLYLNGIYWGIYNLIERPDARFCATYLGGKQKDWDVIKDDEVDAGDDVAWQAFFAAAQAVGEAETEETRERLYRQYFGDEAREPLCDMNNYIDYLLVNFFVGSWDWPFHNFVALRRRDRNSPFQFTVWDAEATLGNGQSPLDYNAIEKAREGVAEPFWHLRKSAMFRSAFAERVTVHFQRPQGVFYVNPLDPAWNPDKPGHNRPAALYVSTANEIRPALIAEAARWGARKHAQTGTPATWEAEFQRLLREYFPQRSAIVLQQLREAGLFAGTPGVP